MYAVAGHSSVWILLGLPPAGNWEEGKPECLTAVPVTCEGWLLVLYILRLLFILPHIGLIIVNICTHIWMTSEAPCTKME